MQRRPKGAIYSVTMDQIQMRIRNQGQPDLDANELALLSSLQKTEDALVRAADIDRLPQELQEIADLHWCLPLLPSTRRLQRHLLQPFQSQL
jgi:hypothetical protein